MLRPPTPLLVAATVAGAVLASGLTSPAEAAGKKPSSTSDRSAPTVTIKTPTSSSSVAGTVSVTGTGLDNVALSSVAVSVDGGPWNTASGTSSWSWSWNTASLTNGSHTVAARAVDTTGNASTSSVAVTVDNVSTPPADTTAPTVAFSTPASGATVSGSTAVSGTASDSSSIAKVEVKVDSGAWQVASGTSSWSWTWPTGSYADGSHTLATRATDGAGNVSATTTRTVTVSNSSSSDSTGPAVSITKPTGGATVSGTVSVQGTVSDPSGVASLEVSVDGRAWQPVYASSSWSWFWGTTRLANGTHTLRVRAIDGVGNAAVATTSATVNNPCLSGAAVQSQAVTAEGVVIRICTATGGWTTKAVEDLLRPNARDLTAIGPNLVIEVQTSMATGEATGSGSDGPNAVLYLNSAASSNFTSSPDALMAHEYGHAWTNYWKIVNPANQGGWDSYLRARGLYGDSRVNSTSTWSTVEMVADDYRRLFGTAAAQSQLRYLNAEVPDSQAVAGLADFFVTEFAIP